jgi:DNA-binding protein HU-beta
MPSAAARRFSCPGSCLRPGHPGRNPATGDEIKIPASVVPRVKVGKVFKDAMAR